MHSLTAPDKGIQKFPVERIGYSPAEFAAAFGKHTSWAYRMLYDGKVNAVTTLGRILIPADEATRIMAGAAPYNPPQVRSPRGRKPKIGRNC